jgi:hypothetical protein
MNLRVNALLKLREKLLPFLKDDCLNHLPNDSFYDKGKSIILNAKHYNRWFLEDQVIFALQSWANALEGKNLEKWLHDYAINEPKTPKKVGLILAGNIPLVGFHDVLTTFISGHIALIKLSSQDKFLIPWLLESLSNEFPEFAYQFEFVERLSNFDAVIATGNDNSASYFDYYFSKVPNIIRRNRNSVAILTGEESAEELMALGQDIFQYFGMGCRNVSKIYVPENYNFKPLFDALLPFESFLMIEKYGSNYDYNKAVFLMSNFKIMDTGFLTLKEDDRFSSPISTLFYSFYSTLEEVYKHLEKNKDKIQCVVSKYSKNNFIAFGQTQSPELWDYADGENTLKFLLAQSHL